MIFFELNGYGSEWFSISFSKESSSAFLFPKQKRNAGKEKCLASRSKTADEMAKITFSKAESITRRPVITF